MGPRGLRGRSSRSRSRAGRYRTRTRPVVAPTIKGDTSQPGLCHRACHPSSHPLHARHHVLGNSEHGVIPVPPHLPFAHPRGASGSLLINPSCSITARMIPLDIHPDSRSPDSPRDFFFFSPLPGRHLLIASQHPNAISPANSALWLLASLYSNSRLGQSTEPCGEQFGISRGGWRILMDILGGRMAASALSLCIKAPPATGAVTRARMILTVVSRAQAGHPREAT